MAKEIRLYTRMMRHSGGSKFYEAILIVNNSANRGVLVRRWGKMGAARRGGELKIEPFADRFSATHAWEEIIKQKEKRDYNQIDGGFGLHTIAIGIAEEKLGMCLQDHYCDKATAASVLHHLGIGEYVSSYEPPDYEYPNDVIEEKPEPEPERSDDWGSW